MKADVTAENKPAFPQHAVHTNAKMHGGNSAHKYQRAVQILITFLDKVAVMIVRCVVKLIVELDNVVASCSEAWEERR